MTFPPTPQQGLTRCDDRLRPPCPPFLIDRAIASMEGLPLHDIVDDRLAEYVEDALIGLKGFTTFRDGFQRRASEGGWTRQDTQDLAGFIAELEGTSKDISLLRKKLKVR